MDGDFAAKRKQARAKTSLIHAGAEARGEPLAWFDEVYRLAGGDPAMVPWADEETHPGLAEWIARSGTIHEGRAIDIGCGLGDNAEALCSAGYDVTAFDLSPIAIEWARKRFPDSPVNYVAASLLDLPGEWLGKFDLVHETYTLQSLKSVERAAAFPAVASLVAPGGTLLVICRVRDEETAVAGPPWPLTREEVLQFENLGMIARACQSFSVVDGEQKVDHIRAVFEKVV
jgi:2-polyprenyl-3-methyl-5-hydroxy-6-metoxy-1,4-benzoquinol methylase